MKVCMVTDFYDSKIVGGAIGLNKDIYTEFKKRGHNVTVFHPGMFDFVYHPILDNVKLAKDAYTIKFKLEELKPDLIIVLGELNLSTTTITYCRMKGIPFLTFYQTKFPEFVEKVFNLPIHTTCKYLEWYHYKAVNVLSISESMTQQLFQVTNICNIKPWFGGVNLQRFNPAKKSKINQFNPDFDSWPKPVLLCVSRASPEKNLEAFLSIDYSGTKVLLGDGPILQDLKTKYPDAKCLGAKGGDELAAYYAAADLFVFPSKSDAFGMVNIEALASGTPLVGYNATGISEIIEVGVNGYLATEGNLENSITKALQLNRSIVYKSSLKWSVENSVEIIIANGQLIDLKYWHQIDNPTIVDLLMNFKTGIHLFVYGFYYYILHLIYGMINGFCVLESLQAIILFWLIDFKKMISRIRRKIGHEKE